MRKLVLIAPLLVLTGCFYNQTGIQGDYEEVRVGCQGDAEARIDTLSGARSEKDRNAELVTLFSDCMAKEGWQVATPKREADTVRMGSDGVAKRVKAQASPIAGNEPPVPMNNPQQAPVQDGAVVTESTALSPSPGMPPLRQPVNPNASMYQPAPEQPATYAPNYGSGPGRSF